MNITENRNRFAALTVTVLLAVSLFRGCARSTSNAPSQTAVQGETPVAPEKNPPGDIPDTQVFVEYRSAGGGYQLEVPEGWARRGSIWFF